MIFPDPLQTVRNTGKTLNAFAHRFRGKTGSGSEIEILPYIDAESDRARTLIASFEVDSLEMIESARIPLSAGKNHVPFQQTVRIVKPLLWQPKGTGMPSRYMQREEGLRG